jgi:hypothetical protein
LGRSASAGGRLLTRGRWGRVRPFLKPGILYDVSDPSVSWDGKLVAFAGKVHPDSSWRIWTADADGTKAKPLTGPGAGDDLDPVWLPDGRIIFASTRHGGEALSGSAIPVTNLFSIRSDGSALARITLERNGGEEPQIDSRQGRIVYARWWFSPFLPSNVDSLNVTRKEDRNARFEEINLWQAVAVLPDGDGIRLAGGHPALAGGVSLYQPALFEDGTLAGIDAENRSLEPEPGSTRLVIFPHGFATPRFLTEKGRAAAPLPLSDGRIVFSWDPEGNGDLDLYVVTPGVGRPKRVEGLAGFDDLDATLLGARPRATFPAPLLEPAPLEATPTMEWVHTTDRTFRFDCLNVFMNAPVDAPFPDAPPATDNVRIRFFTLVPRPKAEGGDTLVLVREAPVTPDGAVHEHELPADIPLFEQLVDADGRILRNPHGLAHVPGFNFARTGSGTKCVGCHTGHSAQAVPKNYESARWFNAAPSAAVTATSARPGGVGPRGVVDRRTKGAAEQVAWIAAGQTSESVTLSWKTPLEIRALRLYAPRRDRVAGTKLEIGRAEVVLTRTGREVARQVIDTPLAADGTALAIPPVAIDGLTVHLGSVSGTVRHRPVAALAEIEVEARLLGLP